MSQTEILIPAMALVGWTLCVLLLMPYQRFKAVFAGHITPNDFKLGESSRVPPVVSIPNRNFMNLLILWLSLLHGHMSVCVCSTAWCILPTTM